MDSLFEMEGDKKYINIVLSSIFIFIGFLGVLPLIFYYIKKKTDACLTMIGIGLAISGINFRLSAINSDLYFFSFIIFVIKPFVFLMMLIMARTTLDVIKMEKPMFLQISNVLFVAEVVYVPLYLSIILESFMYYYPKYKFYFVILDIYLTVTSQVLAILLVVSSLFLSQHKKKFYLMLSMIPSSIVIIAYFILELIYKNVLEKSLNGLTDKDPNDYYAAICYCIFISCGVIPLGFIPIYLNDSSDEQDGIFKNDMQKELMD